MLHVLHGKVTMLQAFNVIEHVVPCQYIREWPRATANGDEDILNLCVKQYIPRDNPDPRPEDVTIIAAYANGFPKVSTRNLLTQTLINH